METNSLFYIQSMTKPIITAAFMMLYEEGHFLLTDPVSMYLPKMKDLRVSVDVSQGKDGETVALESEITISQLLTHTAGLSHGLGGSTLDRELMKTVLMSPHENISARTNVVLDFPLIGQPGEQWYYSFAPDVLSVLIEQFSGMSTNEFLQRRIFDPLGMNNTGYNVPAADANRIVMNHGFTEAGDLQVTENQPPNSGVTVWSGVNALYSTIDDYFIFCQMLLNGGSYNNQQLLSRKTVELMTLNQTGDLFPSPGEGFGLGFAVVTDLAETKNLGSEGLFYWSGAFNTHFFVDPKEKIIAVLMSQRQPHDSFYHRKLRQLVYQAVVE
jgi:CubicO group peptidase (beta-lactamase class C family)